MGAGGAAPGRFYGFYSSCSRFLLVEMHNARRTAAPRKALCGHLDLCPLAHSRAATSGHSDLLQSKGVKEGMCGQDSPPRGQLKTDRLKTGEKLYAPQRLPRPTTQSYQALFIYCAFLLVHFYLPCIFIYCVFLSIDLTRCLSHLGYSHIALNR